MLFYDKKKKYISLKVATESVRLRTKDTYCRLYTVRNYKDYPA